MNKVMNSWRTLREQHQPFMQGQMPTAPTPPSFPNHHYSGVGSPVDTGWKERMEAMRARVPSNPRPPTHHYSGMGSGRPRSSSGSSGGGGWLEKMRDRFKPKPTTPATPTTPTAPPAPPAPVYTPANPAPYIPPNFITPNNSGQGIYGPQGPQHQYKPGM